MRAASRKVKNRIHAIQSAEGMATSPVEIEDTIFNHMNNIIGTNVPCLERFDWDRLNLPKPDLSDLDAPFSEEEVRKAIFDSAADKAPGPDGFSITFFRTAWAVIKQDMLNAVNKFFDLNEPSFHCLNSALFVLLPKNDQPTHATHYRPISLIHSFAKLMSKIMSNRLQPRLDELISPCQSAFIAGRSIQDNFLYVQNLAKYYHRNNTPALLLKLDIAKAFDTVSWQYLLDMLQARGFPSRFRDWIALLFRTASSQVLINGVPGRSISHQRGLRQGDSLSPFLFDLAMEPLHRLLEIATEEGMLSKLKGKQCSFRASLYADDVALFINPSQDDILGTHTVLQAFGSATGLITNLTKSSVTPIRCHNINLDKLLSSIGVPVVHFPCIYLGMPLSVKRLTKADWQMLLDKVDRYLATWKARLMSKAGRLEMLNSVLTSLAVYLMTINDMPAWVRLEFDRRRRAWLWAGEATCNGGKCRVSWRQACRPKALGGLGIHCIKAFSTALRLRWMWQKWKSPHKPWAHMNIASNRNERELFSAATKITVGDGKTATFWTDRWLNNQAPCSIAPDIFKISIRKNRTVADALQSNRWLQDLRFHLSIDHIPQLIDLAERLEEVTLNNTPDDIEWRFDSKGSYSAGSAYKIQFIGAMTTNFKKTVWTGWAPARCKFFIWTLMLNKVLTADALLRRQWDNEYFCPLCHRNLETPKHLFTECLYTNEVWMEMANRLRLTAIKPNNWIGKDLTIQEWFTNIVGNRPKEETKVLFPVANLICWEIWKERNRRIFERKEQKVADLIGKIIDEARAWQQAGAPIPLVDQTSGSPFDPG
jgi:hypothetical protein